MNGDLLTKTFMKTIRDINKLDKLIFSWESTFFAKHDPESMSAQAVNNLTYEFMLMVLTSPMDLRYENRFFYFQKDKDIIKISLTEFADIDYSLFLRKWSLLFKTKVCFVNNDHELDSKQLDTLDVIQSEYRDCLHNDIIETHFPHVQLIARYMCLSLKKSVRMLRFVNNQHQEDIVYVEDLFFSELRNLFLNAAVRLSMNSNSKCARVGMLMQKIIYQRLDRIVFGWDPNAEVYPGFLDDYLQ